MTPAIGAAVDPLVAVKAYLMAELSARGDDQHVGVTPPTGKPDRYILIGYGDENAPTRFLGEHLVDIVLYDSDAERLGLKTHLVVALMRSVSNTPVDTEQGRTHLIAGRLEFGPKDYPDPDVPLFGRRIGVGLLMANTIL